MLLLQSFPLDMAYSQYVISQGRRTVQDARARRESFVFPGVKRLTTDAGPEVYVVMIGESSRRESWALFGYGRNTNPQLASVAREGELFPFDRIRSNSNVTIYSIPLALTGIAPSEHWRASEEKSIVGLANQAGFDTYWISTQEMFGDAANSITSIAQEANHVRFVEASARKGEGFHDFTGAYDEDILKIFGDAVAQKSGNQKKMIFIHTMGSHRDYSSRFPVEHAAFSKARLREARSDAQSQAQAMVDAYDDSILYTDYVIKKVVDILAGLDYPSALLYFSDHGERMYCNAYPRESFSHGFLVPAKDELDVPALLWLSHSYMRQYPQVADAARANAHVETSLDSVFDTCADLIRVDVTKTRRSESLLANSPAPASFDVLGVDGLVHLQGKPQRVCGWEHQ
jgi:glucan phosphoethanolaminetransferase (alkaline phosphatase superfamily)